MMSAVLVAVITGSFGLMVVWLQHRWQRTNSQEHRVARDLLTSHTEQIGVLEGRVDGVREDVRDVRNDVRDVRDAVIGLRDSLTFGMYEDHFQGRDWSVAADATVGEFDSVGLGVALGGGDGDADAEDGRVVKEPDPFLAARRFPEGLF